MGELKNREGLWQYFMLVLSVLSLVLLAAQTLVPLTPSTQELLTSMDYMVCVVFFSDFIVQLLAAKSKMTYLKWGWLDFISSIPMVPALRLARVARIFRIIRILRGAKASKHLLTYVLTHRARNTFLTVLIGSFILLLFASVAIVIVEPSLTGRDAFWWCFFTLLTGEYGDFYPATTEGRVLTALLMTAGVAIFGTFTASVASFFLEGEHKEDEERDREILVQIENLSEQIRDLKQSIETNEKGQ